MIRSDALKGKRSLVVEDEAFFGFYVADSIQDSEGTVIGPFASTAEGIAALDGSGGRIDAASLDIRLREGVCFQIADRLAAAGTPFIFVSGTVEDLPAPYLAHPALQKPVAAYQIVEALVGLLNERG